VENEAGLLHHEREVLVEKGETEGRPDYNFRLAGQTKFFVEAKAPSEPLSAAKHILQAKGYAWNTKQVFFVILTDFEEFRFYDASIQPDERKPDEGLLFRLKYTDYLKQADKLWEFSKERVAAGSLDAMLPRDRRTQRLRIPVDEAFLDEMTGWREDLARNVFKNNPDLNAKQLNEVVQRLLDRIVFIRIAEDRRIIEKMQLWDAVQHWKARGEKFHIFDWLNDLFHRINEDFNGEIFKPHLSETIKIDSEVLAKIIERLYPPKSPYRFDVIGVELLGSIYERYLGKTIRPTAKTVRVEEKPEVRKAGGVYYTPKYIVDYIVKNTVGKVIEGKSPKQIEKIRILDPACGSGSFLIGAFQYLIDHHVRYLTAHPKEAHIHPLFPDLIRDGNGGHRLSVRLKAKILRHNLYGVDIDPQAVEITMMSLYLKALEGEKSQLPPKQSLLPELKYNIICGNSLIGPDIYDQGTLFGDEERDRINAFDWYADPDVGATRWVARGRGDASPLQGVAPVSPPAAPDVILSASEESQHFEMRKTLRGVYAERKLKKTLRFAQGDSERAQGDKPRRSQSGATAPSIPDVMRAGGFDCVIGNPPYVRIQHMKEWAPVEVEFYKQHYKSASSGNYDIYVVFVEKGLSVLKPDGRLGFILPHKFFNAQYGRPLRELISEGKHLSHIVHFGDQQVFDGATNYTCLLFLDKSGNKEFQFEKPRDLEAWRDTGEATEGTIFASKATASEWNFTVGKGAGLFEKLSKMPVKLGDVADIFVGLQTSADTVFLFKDCQKGSGRRTKAFSKELNKPVVVESALLKPVIRSGEIGRFWAESTAQVLFPYKITNGKAWLIPEKEMKKDFPKTWDYLVTNKSLLSSREHGKFKASGWYQLYPKNLERWEQPKIMLPYMVTRLSAFYDEENLYFVNVTTGGFGVVTQEGHGSMKYVTGLLNSTLLDWYLKRVATGFHGGYFAANKQYIEQIPIRTINFSDPADKARHERMVALVERMLDLNKKKHSVPQSGISPSELDRLDREISSTDAAIDDLVYELYDITDEERKIIEGAL
jgi:adenine-specific DNA-methyltransferase